MTVQVFIDGAAGTTGLEIAERLAARADIALITLDDAQRKDAGARRDAFHTADFAILCLPDDAAREAVALAAGSAVRIIDASSAHRVAPGWVYGFAESAIGQRAAIANAARVTNPGCYSTGFIALVAPLVARGLIPADHPLICHAVSGYSGGGKAMIARFENTAPRFHTPLAPALGEGTIPLAPALGEGTIPLAPALGEGQNRIAWRGYALTLDHKHVPEMQARCGLTHRPLFSPAVVHALRGMVVEVPIIRTQGSDIADAATLRAALVDQYSGSAIISVGGLAVDGEILLRDSAPPSDRMTLDVYASDDGAQIKLVAMLDNLGKGASGACVQNLNIMAGLPETAGLQL